MTIKSLFMRNWMNIQEADLDFQDGVNVLAGAFGQGKSAVLEAIAFCVLKDYKRGGSGGWEDYLRRVSDDGEIRLVIQMSDNPDDLLSFHYILKRGYDVEKHVSYAGTSYDSNALVNTFLAKFLDQEMLRNIVFLMQDSDSINKITPAARRDIFKKIFNSEFPEVIAAIERDQELYKTKETEKKIQIEALKVKQYNFQEITEVDPSRLEALKAELATAVNFDAVEQKYRDYQKVLTDMTTLDTSIKDLDAKKVVLATQLESLRTRVTEGEKKKADEVRAAEAKAQEIVAATAVVQTAINAQEAQRLTYQSLLTQDNPIAGLQQEIAEIRTRISATTAEGNLLKTHKEMHERGECTQCGQKTDTSKVAEFETRMAALRTKILDDKVLIEAKETAIDEYKLKIEKANLAQGPLATATSEARGRLRTLEAEHTGLAQKVIATAQAIADLTANQIPRQEAAIAQMGKTIEEKTLAYAELLVQSETLRCEAPVREGRATADIQADHDALVNAAIANIEKTRINNQLIEDKKKDGETLVLYNKELNDIQLKTKRLKAVKKNWETEFPNFINLTGCEILQTQMNKFFEKNRKGFEVKMGLAKKGIDFSYKVGDQDTWGPTVMSSGFESAMLTLSFKVAVANAFGSSLIFLDEPDAAADGEASIRVFETILNIGNFRQQFVISHKPDAVRFLKENGALVYYVKEGAFSTMEQ